MRIIERLSLCLLMVMLFCSLLFYKDIRFNDEQNCQNLSSAMLKVAHAGYSFVSTSVNFEGLTIITYINPVDRSWIIFSLEPYSRTVCHYDHGTNYIFAI